MVRIAVNVNGVWRKVQGLVFKRRSEAEITLARLNSYCEGQEFKIVSAKK